MGEERGRCTRSEGGVRGAREVGEERGRCKRSEGGGTRSEGGARGAREVHEEHNVLKTVIFRLSVMVNGSRSVEVRLHHEASGASNTSPTLFKGHSCVIVGFFNIPQLNLSSTDTSLQCQISILSFNF